MSHFASNRVISTRVDAVSPEELQAWIEEAIEQGEPRGYVCFANAHTSVLALDSTPFRDATEAASLVAPDGAPVAATLSLLLKRRATRCPGPKVMFRCLNQCPHHRHFLLGSTPENLEQIRERFPYVDFVGTYSPPFGEASPEEDAKQCALINAAEPDILWIGLGAPKQELWMHRNLPKLSVPLALGVGAAFDQLAGQKSPAPPWMRDNGLEWLFRWIQEPRRLTGRYLRTNPRFLLHAGAQVLGSRAAS